MHPVFIILPIVVIIVVIVGVTRARSTHLVCPKCGNKFSLPTLKWMFTPKTFGKHDATCPKCGYHGMMAVESGKVDSGDK